ncbi:MAG: hypothetical protein KIT83_14310 [Bryobacterales bacterium]|nr:hypothetical protein [Bryobacterales bacterium]
MKSNHVEKREKPEAASLPSATPQVQKSSDLVLAAKVFLIAGAFFGAVWLLEKLISGS